MDTLGIVPMAHMDSELLGWIHSAKNAEKTRKQAAAEKKTALTQIENWSMALQDEDPDYVLPSGVTVETVTDIEIASEHYSRMALALLSLGEHLPQLMDCVEVKIDTKKLASVLVKNDTLNDLFHHYPMTVKTEKITKVSLPGLVDVQALQDEKAKAIEWAQAYLETENYSPVVLHIDASSRNGLPCHVAIYDLLTKDTWSQLMNPGVSIQTAAALSHGIDDKVVEGMPTLEDIWGEVLDRLKNKHVIVWSKTTKEIYDRACSKLMMSGTAEDIVILQDRYSAFKPSKKGKQGYGAWWSWDEAVSNESLADEFTPPKLQKATYMAKLIHVMAGVEFDLLTPPPAPPQSIGEGGETPVGDMDTEVDIEVRATESASVDVPVEKGDDSQETVTEPDTVDDIPF